MAEVFDDAFTASLELPRRELGNYLPSRVSLEALSEENLILCAEQAEFVLEVAKEVNPDLEINCI